MHWKESFRDPGWGQSIPGGETSWAGAHLVCAGSGGWLGVRGARSGQVGGVKLEGPVGLAGVRAGHGGGLEGPHGGLDSGGPIPAGAYQEEGSPSEGGATAL